MIIKFTSPARKVQLFFSDDPLSCWAKILNIFKNIYDLVENRFCILIRASTCLIDRTFLAEIVRRFSDFFF